MTRKDYIKIADIIKQNITYKPDDMDIDCKGLIQSLCYMFKCDNNNFNADRFKDYINEDIGT